MTRRRSAVVLLACLSFTACASIEEKDKQHKDYDAIEELKEKVSNLKKIEQNARKKEPLGSDALELKKKGNYLCVFVDPPEGTFTKDASGYNGKHDTSECTGAASSGPGNVSRDKVDACNDVRYVAAIKTRNLIKPSVADNKTFKPGLYQYDLLVYDFESGKYKSGTIRTAENSDNVKANLGGSADDRLLMDLLNNACKDVEKAIEGAAKSAAK